MTSSLSESPTLHEGPSYLSYDDLKSEFPLVLNVRAEWGNNEHPVDMPIESWFQTDRADLVDPAVLPKAIGRTYFLKHGKQIEMTDVKRYLRKSRNGSGEKPVPMNQLGQLISDAMSALTPASTRERKKSPHLTFIDLQAQFPHLFEADSLGRLKINTRKTAVEAWFETANTSLVDPAALTKIIGRAFYLKHRKPINTRHISTYLNGSGETPVPLNELGKLVSAAVAELIKGPTERPERMPDDVVPERPVYMVHSIFKANNRLKKYKDPSLFINKKSKEYLMQVARGLITPLKGIAPDSAKGTGKQICKKVFDMMK